MIPTVYRILPYYIYDKGFAFFWLPMIYFTVFLAIEQLNSLESHPHNLWRLATPGFPIAKEVHLSGRIYLSIRVCYMDFA